MKRVIFLAALALSQTAVAELYKCPKADKRIEFSDTPCVTGLRKTGDEWVSVAEENKIKSEQIRQQKEMVRQAAAEKKAEEEKARKKEEEDQRRAKLEADFPAERPFGLAPWASSNSNETKAEKIDKMTTYAVMLGRGVACGVNVEDAARRVGAWLDSALPRQYIPMFVTGMKHHADLQRAGKTPDSCSTVIANFRNFPFP